MQFVCSQVFGHSIHANQVVASLCQLPFPTSEQIQVVSNLEKLLPVCSVLQIALKRAASSSYGLAKIKNFLCFSLCILRECMVQQPGSSWSGVDAKASLSKSKIKEALPKWILEMIVLAHVPCFSVSVHVNLGMNCRHLRFLT